MTECPVILEKQISFWASYFHASLACRTRAKGTHLPTKILRTGGVKEGLGVACVKGNLEFNFFCTLFTMHSGGNVGRESDIFLPFLS